VEVDLNSEKEKELTGRGLGEKRLQIKKGYKPKPVTL